MLEPDVGISGHKLIHSAATAPGGTRQTEMPNVHLKVEIWEQTGLTSKLPLSTCWVVEEEVTDCCWNELDSNCCCWKLLLLECCWCCWISTFCWGGASLSLIFSFVFFLTQNHSDMQLLSSNFCSFNCYRLFQLSTS